MTRAQYIANMIGLYACFALIVAGCLALIASITVLPMWANYRDHGSIFLEEPLPPSPSPITDRT